MEGLINYCLRCSVCEREFSSKSEWHAHYLSEEHQVKARVECVEEWAVSKVKKRSCLVIYSSFPLTGGGGGGAEQVLHHFSRDPGNFVTDFVCWEERPYLAILQFECRAKVDEVLAKADGTNVSVAGQRIQVKRASKLLQLEWNAISQQDDSVQGNGEGDPNSAETRESTKRSAPNSDTTAAKRQKLAEGAPPVEKVATRTAAYRWHPPALGAPPNLPAASLALQFWLARKVVSTSDEEDHQVWGILKKLQEQWRFKKSVGLCLLGKWYLRLGNLTANDELTIYAYWVEPNPKLWFSGTLIEIPDSVVKNVFELPQLETDFDDEGGGKYVHKESGRSFTLVTSTRHFMELKIRQLVKYMCSFDSRCYPLLTLAQYWCHVNGMEFGGLSQDPDDDNTLPPSLTLEWLVVFWLSHKKLIPTVREIQVKPHRVVKEPQMGVDVGFDQDPKWAQEWKNARKEEDPSLPLEEDYASEEFILNMLQLFQEFMEFFGMLKETRTILNTRDAELIDTQEFTSCLEDADKWADPSAWSTCGGMTRAELAGLRLIENKKKKSVTQTLFTRSGLQVKAAAHYPACDFKTQLPDWRLYMINPFSFAGKFSMSKELSAQLEGMRRSALKLNKFLQMGQERGHGHELWRFGGTLEKLLKIPWMKDNLLCLNRYI